MQYFLYIIYSESFNTYYVGQTHDVEMRLIFHNELSGHRSTTRYRPWVMKLVIAFSSRGHAMKAEKIVKARKSRKYIEKLIELEEVRNQLKELVERSAG